MSHDESRRQFLKYIAASPLLAYPQSTRRYAGLGDGLIESPEHALDVFDFRAVAESVLPSAHWGYLQTSIDDDATLRRNREGFTAHQLRPRRLIDVRHIDMSTEIFGKKWPTPIVIAPTGSNQAFHPEGALAVARAARAKNHLQMLSTVANTPIEDINEARGEPVWYQLYPRYDWNVTLKMVKRAEAAGCPAVALTVDNTMGSNRETVKRFSKLDNRECLACHSADFKEALRAKPMYDGLEIPESNDYSRSVDWEFVRRLRDATSMKVLIKGIVRGDDAALAVENGVDGIVVSNHGARAVATDRSTIECLPEVVEAVQGRILVLVDSGFRRGTDFFKALALGADAVLIGRPYLWGLAAFGQQGVEAVLDMLRKELELVMRQAGTTTIAQIDPSYLAKKP
jgi:4-hydroxymandelate oxidase